MAFEPQVASCVEVSWHALMRLVDLVRRAGAEILAHAGRGSMLKPDGSPVTSADVAAQDVICAGLTDWDPSVPIVAEEAAPPDPARGDWSRYWLVDPLDGTKEFLAGRPDFTVNVALIEDGTPVLGVVGAPAMATVYWAGRGFGAWRQEGQDPAIRLRRMPPTGDGVRIVESRSHPSAELEMFLRQVRVIERVQVGSSLKFCWLADGRADCYPRFGPTMAWDVAAGDCVFRYASPGLEPFPSPLTYDPRQLRQPPFVIGVGPDVDAVRVRPAGQVHVDPERLRSAAAAAGVTVHRGDPLNGETPLEGLIARGDGAAVAAAAAPQMTGAAPPTPTGAFFIRCHAGIPDLSTSTFRLRVGGLVERPLTLALDELQRGRIERRTLTLECAGNGRALFAPGSGEPWTLGAVGTAVWTGVPLADVLALAGPRAEACDVVFRGGDVDAREDRFAASTTSRFERSLRLDQARTTGALLAYAMNGAALSPAHGAPLRLVVPGWYGMAWVKWLTEIELIGDPFTGVYQTERYVYIYDDASADEPRAPEAVTCQRVRALILSPFADACVSRRDLVIEGVAWSGEAPVACVEVAADDGPWHRAALDASAEPFGWRHWQVPLDLSSHDVPASGVVVLRARASDCAGHVQPDHAACNRHGYGNNQIHRVSVRVT